MYNEVTIDRINTGLSRCHGWRKVGTQWVKAKRTLCPLDRPRTTLADPMIGDKTIRKADGGRRPKAIREIPDNCGDGNESR
jgi:hypothetical protein